MGHEGAAQTDRLDSVTVAYRYWQQYGLSTRAFNVLVNEGIPNKIALAGIGRRGLLRRRIQNCGLKTIDEIGNIVFGGWK